MRQFINSIVLLVAIACFLAGCTAAQAQHDDIKTPPPTANTSVATEDIVAQKAAALSRTQVDAATVKADLAAVKVAQHELSLARTADQLTNAKIDLANAQADLLAAQRQGDKDRADLLAANQMVSDQAKAEQDGKLYSYITYAVPVAIAAGIALYEGWRAVASVLGIIAAGLIVAPMLSVWILNHGRLLGTLGTLAALGSLAYKYRGKIPAIEATAKKDLLSAEAALAHVVSGGTWASAESHVKEALVKSYCWIKGIALTAEHKIEAVIHLKQAPSGAPIVPPVTPTKS